MWLTVPDTATWTFTSTIVAAVLTLLSGLATAWFSFHGVHAQNYHIFTPHVGKDWCMAWGAPSWTKELPWANAAQKFDFTIGTTGQLRDIIASGRHADLIIVSAPLMGELEKTDAQTILLVRR